MPFFQLFLHSQQTGTLVVCDVTFFENGQTTFSLGPLKLLG
jgi:hypothetical protein